VPFSITTVDWLLLITGSHTKHYTWVIEVTITYYNPYIGGKSIHQRVFHEMGTISGHDRYVGVCEQRHCTVFGARPGQYDRVLKPFAEPWLGVLWRFYGGFMEVLEKAMKAMSKKSIFRESYEQKIHGFLNHGCHG
jgi:hypothetical protein